jgi:hypothetical protein
MRAVLCVVALSMVACAPTTLRLAEEISHFGAKYEPTPGDEMAAGLADLEQRLKAWGVRLVDLHPKVSYLGYAEAHTRTIYLQPWLSVNARFEVLAHEAGHFLQPPTIDEQTKMFGQLFAEMVGVGVQKFYHSKTAERVAAPYLAQMKYTFPAYKWMRRDIDRAVKALTGQIPLPEWRTP